MDWAFQAGHAGSIPVIRSHFLLFKDIFRYSFGPFLLDDCSPVPYTCHGAARAHDVIWSDDLLDEWERVIVRERHRSPDAAAAITATIRQFFADTRMPVQSYRGLVAEADGPDPDDNAHMAAAVAGQVELLVTWNAVLFASLDPAPRARIWRL
jgi:predicted nucleic acid-binding protein